MNSAALNSLSIVRYALGLLLIALPTICSAAAPALLGAIDVQAPITQIRVTSDGKRVVALVQPLGNKQWEMRIIDTSHPEMPILKGSLNSGPGNLALALDGQYALVLVQPESGKFGATTSHEIIAVDLSNPYEPKERWRRIILARKVILADDASAYAASQPSHLKQDRWQTTVTWVNSERPETIVEEAEHSSGEMHFSDRASFLVFSQFAQSSNQFRLSDLRDKKPVLFEQGYTFLQRHGCTPTTLETGHIIVEDERAPRLGIYAPQSGIPRIATVDHDGVKHCTRLSVTPVGGSLVFTNSYSGRLDGSIFDSLTGYHSTVLGNSHQQPIQQPSLKRTFLPSQGKMAERCRYSTWTLPLKPLWIG